MFPGSVFAQKTLYVDLATGNDSTTYANNSEVNPWRTLGRAAWGSTNRNARNPSQAARAGDTVLVAAGTYSGPGSNSRNIPTYYTENSGTAANPIVFRAVGTVILTLSSGNGPVIGAYLENYITWDGFTIHEANAPSRPDTGSVTLFGCTGCVLQNLDINGNGLGHGAEDNHNGIRIEDSHDILIRNNRIQNVYTASSNANNGAGIMVYGSGAVTFEHNEIFDCGSGIDLKGGPNVDIDFFTIRYNVIYNIGVGGTGNGIVLHAGAATTPEAPTRIYQNVIRNVVQAGVRIWRFSDTDPTNTPMNGKIVNNTIYNVGRGVWVDNEPLPNAGFVFRNNVVMNADEGAIHYNGNPSLKSKFDSEHNVYFAFGSNFAVTTSDTHSLSNWKNSFGQDAASPASVNSNPLFVDAGNLDFRLSAGSPALARGRDFLDLDNDGNTNELITAGAYITGNEVIGRTQAVPDMPTAPTNLRVTPQ
jgi:hypothetical protein